MFIIPIVNADLTHKLHWSQECIPVGSIPSTVVAVCWGDLPRGQNRMTHRHLWKHYLAATTLQKVKKHAIDTIRVHSHLATTTHIFDVVRDKLHGDQYNCSHMTTGKIKTHRCRQVWTDRRCVEGLMTFNLWSAWRQWQLLDSVKLLSVWKPSVSVRISTPRCISCTLDSCVWKCAETVDQREAGLSVEVLGLHLSRKIFNNNMQEDGHWNDQFECFCD